MLSTKLIVKNCEKNYIGQIKRLLITRVDEHRKNINLLNPKYHSVITKHRIENEHNFNWEKVLIKDKEINTYKREISKMIFIKNNKQSLNTQREIAKFNDTYLPIITE